MSELDAFEDEVRKNIKLLSSDNAKVRRKAAAWLGEAGDPSAITRLRQVYKEDPDRKVRDAAGYSLGMFRALEQGLDSDKREAVMKRLEDIAVRGRIGRRARFRASALRRINLGLLVSLVMLLAFTFVVWPRLAPSLAGLSLNAGTGNRTVVLRNVEDFVTKVSADATTLQRQYQNVLGGGTVDCSVTFTSPAPYDPAAASGHSDLMAIIERANTALAGLNDAKTAFVQACPPNNTPLTGAEIGAPLSKLTPVIQALPEITAALATARGEAVVPTPTVPQATAAPTAVLPTSTPAYDVTPHTTALTAIIDRMEGAGGANAVLAQYWADVRASGTTGGCGGAAPTIPGNYALPEADLNQAPQELKLAVDTVNTGLELVRRGWTQFTQACSANNLAGALENGAVTTEAATRAFEGARAALNLLNAG